MPGKNSVHVAVGVIVADDGQILIALRAEQRHQGGLWEFPGGKVEAGETVQQALDRELSEELGIAVIAASPLIVIEHDYADKSVCLDVWWVDKFNGIAEGKEGQPIKWVSKQALSDYAFPQANHAIVAAIQASA